MPRKTGLRVDFDAASMANYLGAMEGVVTELETSRNIRTVAKGVQQRLIYYFDMELSATAASAGRMPNNQGALRNPYEHVFEPGYVGVNQPWAKLWVHMSSGVGRDRISSFMFRDSKLPLEAPTVENTGLPDEVVEKLKPKMYVFEKRARIEEAGLDTVLRPNPKYTPVSKKLVVPGTTPRGYYFTEVYTYKRSRSPMRGQFVSFWTMWWGTRAKAIYEGKILPNLDEKIYRAALKAGKAATRTRKGTKAFSVQADASKEAAQLMVQAEITGWEKYVVEGSDEVNIFE